MGLRSASHNKAQYSIFGHNIVHSISKYSTVLYMVGLFWIILWYTLFLIIQHAYSILRHNMVHFIFDYIISSLTFLLDYNSYSQKHIVGGTITLLNCDGREGIEP